MSDIATVLILLQTSILSQSAGDINHKLGGRLPLLSTMPVVTFSAKEITRLASTKLYCLVTEAHRC